MHTSSQSMIPLYTGEPPKPVDDTLPIGSSPDVEDVSTVRRGSKGFSSAYQHNIRDTAHYEYHYSLLHLSEKGIQRVV